MARVDVNFKTNVFNIVTQIPRGRIMTYGQIAALCNTPWAAWEVGQVAHYGDPNLPWQRVVNKQGGLAKGYPGGVERHRRDLEAEGIKVNQDNRVDVKGLLWWPPNSTH